MNFQKHLNLEGLHAPFSPSQSSWLRYDDDKALEVYRNRKAAQMGTRLHAWAKDTIDLGIKQPRSKKTIYAYVNDAIGFKMSTEVVLYYSDRFFGTADSNPNIHPNCGSSFRAVPAEGRVGISAVRWSGRGRHESFVCRERLGRNPPRWHPCPLPRSGCHIPRRSWPPADVPTSPAYSPCTDAADAPSHPTK